MNPKLIASGFLNDLFIMYSDSQYDSKFAGCYPYYNREYMRLTELKNIKPHLAQQLKDIGIDSVERLAEREVFDVWVELQRIHPQQTSVDTLWDLEGAVLNVDARDIPQQRREELQKKLKNLRQTQ